jgi:uncharacterized protein (TIGR02145 family)
MGTLKTGAYCDGDNDDNGTIYGKQYNWYAVMGINTVESATPTTEEILARKKLATGWHVPSDEEWATLTTFRSKPTGNVGGKMKQVGTTHWFGLILILTSGFTALPEVSLRQW